MTLAPGKLKILHSHQKLERKIPHSRIVRDKNANFSENLFFCKVDIGNRGT